MGRRRKFSGLDKFQLSHSACLTMIVSAAEVYPRECMGGICCTLERPNKIVAAFPWQKARRKYLEVISESSYQLSKVIGARSPWTIHYDYHSHTYRTSELLENLEPSKQDIRNLEVGGVEFIVRIHTSKKNAYYMQTRGAYTESAYVEAALGKYRFQIKAFQREAALDSKKVPLYKTIGVKLVR